MIKIDKGIPIPPTGQAGGRIKYPWRTMEIGDSFFVESDNPQKTQAGMMSNCRFLKPLKFTSQIVAGGVRFWRIE